MANTKRRYVAITPYDAALCTVFGALAAAAVMLAMQDPSWTHRASSCAQPITADANLVAAPPVGAIAATGDLCHP